MSQIFDALHRAETERRSIDLSEVTAAPELLEGAERQLAPRETEYKRRPDIGDAPFSHFQSVPVLVSPQSKLVCITDRESLAAEKFRFLGVRLSHLQQKRPIKRLLITSSVPEEGKSTVATNLACTLATRQRQKVLLLEGDLRRPTLAKEFGLGKQPGLSEWLESEASPATNICELESLGLWLLPAGTPPSEPLELLQSAKLSLLMDQLNSWFDWIVIDSPPVLPLGDTSIWMRLADAILLVTRPGKTEKRQLQRTLEAVEQPKLLGALVNGSIEATSSSYYYYQGGRASASSPTGHPPQ